MSRAFVIAFLALATLLIVGRVRKLLPAEETTAAAQAEVARSASPSRPAPSSRRAPAPAPVTESRTPASDVLARAEARRILLRSGGLTYIDSLFAETDSVLRRWPDRDGTPLTVAFALLGDSAADQRLAGIVARALRAWEQQNAGIAFVSVTDTAGASIVVVAQEQLVGERAGQTDLRWTRDGAIHAATIIIALKTLEGAVVPDEGLFAVASHEVGHALGLPHSGDPLDVMFSTTRTGKPTLRDQASLRLLYELPLGSVRENPSQ